MPIYEYKCLKCGHQFEKMQNISDNAVKRCEKCGEQVTRLFHPVAVHFKGSGFYTTDYGKRSSRKEKTRADKAQDTTSGGDGRADQGGKQNKEGGKKGRKSAGTA